MKVLLVDDHVLFRRGLALLLFDLDPALEVVHADRVEEVDPAGLGVVDLILLDMQLPGGISGLNALLALRERLPDVPIVMVSGITDAGDIRDCIDAGAAGFIPKSATPELMIGALRLVLAGGIYLPSLVLDDAPGAGDASAPSAGPVDFAGLPDDAGSADAGALSVASLSRRQLEALLHAVQGKSNKAIAREMNIAEGTVKLHLSASYRTLGVTNRTQAVFVVAKLGLKRDD